MGPLSGLRVVEMAGIGPAPFCGMLLADLGAEVLRVDRLAASGLGLPVAARFDLLNRGKRAVAVDLKNPEGIALTRDLARGADALIEGFRPGVMERLGLGPETLLADNPRLVLGRMTGFGQSGPLAGRAGHDINYIGLAGALAAMGPAGEPPAPPLNLVGDFGGGALYLAFGLLAALLESRASGRGQVVDAAMVDGVASLMTMHLSLKQAGWWRGARGANLLDGGAPFYRAYRTRDGGFMAVGAIEEKFYRALLDGLGLARADTPDRGDRANWDALAARFAAIFATRTRAEWTAVFEEVDACVTPVLDVAEAPDHPHVAARGLFSEREGVRQPAPAPRFSRTPAAPGRPPADAREDSRAALAAFGVDPGRIEALAASGVIAA